MVRRKRSNLTQFSPTGKRRKAGFRGTENKFALREGVDPDLAAIEIMIYYRPLNPLPPLR
jgi:hypothetical protein